MSPTQALVLKDVSKAYGSNRALSGVSFTLDHGEFCVLLGPNGAGKTTLFQLLSGLFAADGGRIEVMGHDISRDAAGALGQIGIVFQYPTLDLELSCRANLMFSAGLHGIPRVHALRRIADVLDLMGLSDRAKDKAGALSGGNRRRLEIARALLHQPRLLLMDEPTVGLDPASRASLLALVRDLCGREKIAALWATHMCEEAEQADRIIVLVKGRVLRDSTPRDLRASTQRESVEAAFLALTAQP